MKTLLSILLILFIGCTTEQRRYSTPEEVEQDTKMRQQVQAPSEFLDSLELEKEFELTSLEYARNIGEFFDHRLIFYKIDDPSLLIHKSPVEELVLYFVDSTLARMRFKVNEEVGSYLLDSLGLSRFKPLDSLSRSLLESKKVYDRLTKKLNPELKNYELVWRETKVIKRYRVKTYSDSSKLYYFYDEVNGYRDKIRELERMYNYLEDTSPLLD